MSPVTHRGTLLRSLLEKLRPLARYGTFDQVDRIHTAKRKKERRVFVDPGADASERRRSVLAHARPVRAGTRKFDLPG